MTTAEKMKVESIILALNYVISACEDLLKADEKLSAIISENEPIGDRMRKARKKVGMKQSQLAEASHVSQSMISQYEHGVRNPKLESVMKISRVLGVNLLSGILECESETGGEKGITYLAITSSEQWTVTT